MDKYKDKYEIEPFLKESQYSHWMRCKLTESTLFYNQHKQKVTTVPSKLFGSVILQLSGLWTMDTKAWLQWTVIQGKIYEPVILKEYAFIDDISSSST